MEARHVNDSSCDPCSPAYRCFAHVAVQQGMGLLPKRRIGVGGFDPASACFEWKTLGTPKSSGYPERGLGQLHDGSS
jgi:hypothetical protein